MEATPLKDGQGKTAETAAERKWRRLTSEQKRDCYHETLLDLHVLCERENLRFTRVMIDLISPFLAAHGVPGYGQAPDEDERRPAAAVRVVRAPAPTPASSAAPAPAPAAFAPEPEPEPAREPKPPARVYQPRPGTVAALVLAAANEWRTAEDICRLVREAGDFSEPGIRVQIWKLRTSGLLECRPIAGRARGMRGPREEYRTLPDALHAMERP